MNLARASGLSLSDVNAMTLQKMTWLRNQLEREAKETQRGQR